MKPPLPAVLYGTGLLLAFGAGWFLKPASSPDYTAALSHPALPAKRPGPPVTQKTPGVLATSAGNWLDATASDLAAVRAAKQPGVVNQVLIETLEATLSLTDKFKRFASWQGLMSELRPEDALAVWALLDGWGKEGRETDPELKSFLHQWGFIDGATAATIMSTGRGTALWKNTIDELLAGWGRQDATAALAWLKGQDRNKMNFTLALSGLVQGLAAINISKAETMLLENANDSAFEAFFGELINIRVGREGLAATVARFKQQASEELPDEFKRRNLDALTKQSQTKETMKGHMSAELMELLPFYAQKHWLPENAGQILGQHWAEKNPITGMAEIQKMRSPSAQAAATNQLTQVWAANEPESFSIWLAENRSHPMFDEAAFQLSLTLQVSNPEAAKAWAAEIKDPAMRIHLTDNLSPEPPVAAGQ